jgi:hypothetical protein
VGDERLSNEGDSILENAIANGRALQVLAGQPSHGTLNVHCICIRIALFLGREPPGVDLLTIVRVCRVHWIGTISSHHVLVINAAERSSC